MPEVTFTAGSGWTYQNVGSSVSIPDLVVGGQYLVLSNTTFVQISGGSAEIGFIINTSGGNFIQYSPPGSTSAGVDVSGVFTATAATHTLQRRYRGGNSGSSRYGDTRVTVIRIA